MRLPLHSITLKSGRRLSVYVPLRVAARPRQRVPLLILHDGQNLFEPDRAYIHGQTWRADEAIDEGVAARALPAIIICGVDHAGPDRVRELTPTPGRDNRGGGARDYLAMLADELLPRMRKEFPVRRDRATTGLGGSSLGGLATLFAAVHMPAVFGRLLVMSPSVWWDRRVILRLIARHPNAFAGTRTWLDIGLREGAKAVADTRHLARQLGALKIPRAADRFVLRYSEDADGDHSERSWAARLPAALKFLYETRPTSRK